MDAILKVFGVVEHGGVVVDEERAAGGGKVGEGGVEGGDDGGVVVGVGCERGNLTEGDLDACSPGLLGHRNDLADGLGGAGVGEEHVIGAGEDDDAGVFVMEDGVGKACEDVCGVLA